MTTPRDDDRLSGTSSVGGDRYDDRASRTHGGADVTSRMTGTHGHDTGRTTEVREVRGTHARGVEHAKTSAAATFALVFGLAALFCALTAILSPAAVLFGLIGLVLGIAGMKKGKLPGVTGHKVAVGGLVTAVLGLLLGLAVIAGIAVGINSEGAVDRIGNAVDDLRSSLPSGNQIEDEISDVTGG